MTAGFSSLFEFARKLANRLESRLRRANMPPRKASGKPKKDFCGTKIRVVRPSHVRAFLLYYILVVVARTSQLLLVYNRNARPPAYTLARKMSIRSPQQEREGD